jgi:Asp-tRNA(Asn)/Glu-tRNA(Gln) amidotransferase A subunit family amidase
MQQAAIQTRVEPARRLTFVDRRRAFCDGADSPRALLETCLARIAERDGEVRAFVHLADKEARVAADAATQRYRAGRPLSSIDGVPIALKDIFETADMPTGFGSPIFDGWSGGRDSAVALALREAGAVIVGKVVTTEFASTVPGPTRNPHDLSRTPGGSSSGSAAAVADGMVPVAMGSQVAGSILRPASFCGVIGFKPTFGSLNRGGICDSYSQNTLGPLANSLGDAFAVCHEIAVRVGGDPGFLPFQGGAVPAPAQQPQALAVLEQSGWDGADAGAKREFAALCERLARRGIRLIDRRGSPRIERLEQTIADAPAITRQINTYESHWPLRELAHRRADGLSAAMRERAAQAARMSIDEYQALLVRRDAMQQALLALAGDVDAFITLSSSGPAPLGIESTGDPKFNSAVSALRVPALSLPVLQVDGLPLGLQLVGFPHRERHLSGVAQFLLDHAAH